MQQIPDFTLFTLFGRENPSSIYDRQTFIDIASEAHPWLFKHGRAKIEGLIYGPEQNAKNANPRKSIANQSAVERWADAVSDQRNIISMIRIFNHPENEHYPITQISFKKEYEYDPNSWYHPTKAPCGISNGIVLDLRRLDSADELDSFLVTFRKIAELINAIYGFVEFSSPWMVPNDSGISEFDKYGFHTLPYRYEDVKREYGKRYRISEYASRIERVTILNRGQVRSEIPTSLVKSQIKLSDEVTYYEFIADPNTDNELMAVIRRHVPGIPK